MKNKFNKLSLVFVCLALLCCCAFITPSQNKNTNTHQTVYADDVPAEITEGLFSVVQSNLDGSNGQNIANNQVAFISSGEQVVATFKDPNEGIEGISAYFTFNDETLSNATLADMGIAVEYSDTEFSITSSTSLGTYAPYGKYELHIEYLYQNNLEIVDKSFDYTYYVLRASDYFVGTSVNVIKNKQSITSSSGTYDNTYMFNYQDTTQTDTLELPNIKFDYTKFAVSVTKNFQNSESIQTFTYNGTEVLVNGDNVALYEITPDNQVSLVFNDLGSYDITYTFLYTYNQKVDTINSYTSYNGQKRERLDIFGFQLYYSDINNNGSKEFKNISSTGVVGQELTDISYMGSLNTNLILNKVSYNETTNPKPFLIQRTNQGPLSFKYNVQLDTDNSKIYKLIPTVDENGNISYTLESQAGEKYENTPLTEAGTYIIELSYVYPKHPTSAGATFKQWFVFTLTNDTPTFSIKGANGADAHGNVIYDITINEFINKDVQISKQGTESLFDIPTKLMVYEQTNYTGNWNQGTEVTQNSPLVVSNNANYKVTLHFGKNLAQSYSAFFVIDKTEINNIQKFSSVEVNESGYYVRNEEISFFTNQAVSLFWNEKDSKAKTYAYYKYIPLVERTAAYTDSELKQFYSKFNVPTNYYFDYDPANPLTQINYQNSSTFTEYIPASNILNQNGMYIFRIFDEAGNEKYISFVIDKTSAPILQMVNGEYVDSSDLNILSNDVSVHFGKKRVTQFKNISYSSGAYVAQDPWLQLVLNQTASKNLALLLINTNSSHYITADINNKVLVSESTTYFHNLTEENGYAYEIAFKQQNSNTAIEKQYNFYTRDEINTQKLAANATEASVYKELYSNFLSLKISSDASLTELYYYKANGLRQFLSTDNSFTNQTENQKNIYYKPTTLSTLSSSNEILYLNFFPTPEEGNLEIAEVTYSYQPFKETVKYEPSTTNVAYTYAFEQLPANYSPIIIYSKASPENNLTKVGQDGSLIWEVQKEYSSLLAGYQTKAGKYTITRKYDTTLAGYASSVSNKLDFEIRTLTFIVDRNGIITAPVVVDEETGETSNYVGESIKLQVLDSNTADTKVMFFEDIYLASNMSGGTDGLQAILSTNKLPVQVYVPTFKYGYSYTNGGAFNSENSINSYNNSKIIETYQLNAEIRYSAELPGLATTSTVYYGKIDTNSSLNYLVFNENGRSFTNVGFYQVIIKQGNEVNDRNTFSFIFQITESTPDFSLNTVDDLALNQGSDGLYYTNKEKVRLEWVDPSNQFMANINKSKIAYQINNGSQKFIDKDLIRTSGQINTYDLDLNEIGAYSHGTKVTITMQFEGEEKNYNTGYFKTSKTFVIDTVAPTENINSLVAKTGVEYNQLRNVTTKYNTSVNSGVYKYYAYNVTAENFENYINLYSDQLSEIGYRVFVTEEGNNTKYNDIYAQESDPSIVENSTTNFTSLTATTLPYLLNNISQYIEIYEKDLAGNVTIYTIFLSSTDSLVQSFPSLTYTSNSESKTLYNFDIASTINVFAKGNLDINKIEFFDDNYSWLKVDFAGTTYVRTPYTDGKFYNMSTFEASNPTKSLVTLSQFASLLPSATIQTFKFSLVPILNNITLNASVLNTSLSVLHTTQTTYSTEEGVLIKIPANTSDTNASIYAIKVVIYQYIDNRPQTLYINESQDYFKNIQPLTSSTLLNAKYVQYMSSTYLKLSIATPTANRFYKYEVVDNFGEEYSITNIYGSEEIKNELTSSVSIKQTYENGELYYYSTQNVTFKFNSAKDVVKLTVSSSFSTILNEVNLLSPGEIDLDTYSAYVQVITPAKGSNVYTVILKCAEISMATGKIGDELTYRIDMYEAISTDDKPYRNLNIKIYNIVPAITLYGIENDEQNDLFNKGTIYGEQLRITFTQNVGKYSCTIWLDCNDGTAPEQITSGKLVSNPGTYTLIIKYNQMFTESEYDVLLDFTISDNEEDFYNVVYTKNGETFIAKQTGSEFTYTVGGNAHTIKTHYILNTSDFEIVLNTSQGVKISTEEQPVVVNGYTSYIYTLSNVNNEYTGNKYFTRKIAVTVITETSSILNNFSHYKNDGTRELLSGSLESFVVSKEEDNTAYKRIAFNSYFGIPENKIVATIYYGDQNTLYTPVVETANNLNVITLSTSGIYYITFSDLAGNIHLFENLSDTYEIRYLRSVIYTINGETPINNSVYNDTVTVKIPSSTLKYYDSNAKPRIKALRNGVEYTPTSNTSNTIYTFSTPGLYKIWFSAATGEVDINEEAIYFLIVNQNESRWVYEFSEYGNYFIKQIIKNQGTENEVDMTSALTNENMGNIIYKQEVQSDGTIKSVPYLKNLLVSVFDKQTGQGKYTITICTDNAFNQQFTFTIWINNTTPPIEVSVAENAETIDPITVTFNTQYLLDSVGECILRINGMEDMKFTYQALEEGKLKQSYSLLLDAESRVYYIQVLSQSGKLLYSYRVVKNAPLNTISIILIVVGSIVAIGLTVLFILLRKKMKIR